MKVTVLMPAYNAEPFLAEAIESVLAQTHSDLELIIVDDGSTDNTRAIIDLYADRDARITVVASSHVGIAGVLNQGLEQAGTEWVAIMHADDIMMPNRLERQVDFIRQNSDIDVASSFVYNINDRGERIGLGTSALTNRARVDEKVQKSEVIGFHHPAVIMRKSVVQAVGGYRQAYWPAEDIDLWNRVAGEGYGVAVQPEYLLKYRIHNSAASVANHRLVCQKVRFIEEGVQRRRRGEPEPTWEEFVVMQQQRPVWTRLKHGRKDAGQLLYKRAASSFAERRYGSAFANLAGAVALTPIVTLTNVVRKYGALLLLKKNRPQEQLHADATAKQELLYE